MATRKSELIITCNAKGVENVMRILDERLKGIKQQLQTLNNYGSKHGWTDDMKKDFKELTEEAAGIDTIMKRNQQTMRKYGEVMKDLSGAKLKDLKKALQEGKAALNNMAERDPKRKQLVDDLKRIEAQINKNTGATNKMTGAQKGFSSAIASTAKNLATYMIGFAGFNKVKSLVEDVFRSNLKLSDSLANIRKVSGLSSEAINELYRNISKIDSRNTIETLNQLAYTGAKLGIGQNYGVEGLTGFVKAAEQVQMALGEDMGEKALPDLSKMVEVMGLIPKYGVEQSMQKAASAIFQLGATSTATGTNIVEFSKRLYGLANVSRISTQDLLALGSASDAMGLMPEVSATAFNKLFTSIQRQHNLIEQSLGMTKGTIKQYYDEGKTMDAIVEIFERMNQKGNLNLLGSIFKDLGSDGARLVNVMATMADRADILRKHLQTSRDAFKEGEAVIGEYMIQNQTAAALVERASNLWAKAFVNPEGVDMVKEMAQAWYDLSKQMTQSEALMWSLHNSIDTIAAGISTLIKLFPVLIKFGIWFASVFGFRAAILGIGGLITAFRTLYKDIALATGAMGKFKVMAKSNAILFAISSLLTVISLVRDYSKAAEEAAKREAERQAKLKAAFEESKEAVQNVVKPLERYKRILEEGNLSEKQKLEVIKELNNKYQEYLDYLGIEIKSAADLAKAYAKVVDIMKIKKAYEERESFRQQKNGDNRMSRIENQAKVEAAARSFGLPDIGKAFLEHSQNTYDTKKGKWVSYGTDDVYRQLVERKMGVKAFSQEGGDITFLEIDGKIVAPGTQHGPKAKVRYRKVGSDELYDAIGSYIESYRAERDVNKEVDAMFDSEYSWTDKNGKKRKLSEFNMDEYNDTVQKAVYQRKGSLDNEKPDKEALKAAKKAAQERKKALKLEMDEAQKASTGIISKLEEYYRLQEAAINDARADGQLTEEQAKEMVRALSIVKNESLATARRAVTTGETKDWDELKTKVLPAVMSDTSEVSRNLLSTIQQVAVDKLHTDLQKFNGSSDVLGLDSRAFFDQMNAKAAGNTREAARLKAKLFTQAETMVKQYRIFDQAVDRMRDDVEQMGFITETYEEFADRMQKGITEKPAKQLGMSPKQREQMYRSFKAYGEQSKGPKDSEGYYSDADKDVVQWVQQWSQQADNAWMKGLPQLDEWLSDTDKYEKQIADFYHTLLNMYEGYEKQMQQSGNEGADFLAFTQGQQQVSDATAQLDKMFGRSISDKEAYTAMGFKFLGQGTIPYRINIENGDEALEWMRQFGTTASGELEVWAQAIPELEKWLTLLQRKAELQKEGKDLTADELAELQNAIPQIQALYYKMNEFSDKVPEAISKQVQQMTGRKPIGIVERGEQHAAQVDLTTQLYDNKINEARSSGNEDAALELEKQKKQALIDLEYQYQQELYQIREQMGVNVYEQYEHELAGYKNMLDKKLVSEKQFQQKKGQLQAKLGLQYAEYFNGQIKSLVDTMRDYEITSTENKYDAQINAAKAAGQDTTALEEQKEAEILEIRKKYAAMDLAIKISEIGVNTAVAIMQAYAQLGPIAGSVAAALITALGAAQTAMAIAEYNKVMGQSVSSTSKSTSSNTSKTKLVSGMLTYDSGNVEDYAGKGRSTSGRLLPTGRKNVDKFAGRRKLYDDGETQVYGRRRYLGEDGKVYTATAEPAPKDGLVTHPIATTVQGQPALVAENGPEIVIGRETTKAIMMNEPELIRYLANYQQHGGSQGYSTARGLAAYDSGNVATVLSGSPAENTQPSDPSAEREALINRLDRSDALMEQVLYFLQNPIAPEIAMYDTGGKKGLRSKMKEADRFMTRYGG